MKSHLVLACLFVFVGMAAMASGSTQGVISTVAGNGTSGSSGDGGPATSAQLSGIAGIAVDSAGNLYIAEYFANLIRKVSPDGVITTVIGASGGLSGPTDIAVDAAGNLYICDQTEEMYSGRVVKMTPAGVTSTIGDDIFTSYRVSWPDAVATDSSGNVYIVITSWLDNWSNIYRVSPDGMVASAVSVPIEPMDLALDTAGNVYVSARAPGGYGVWKVDLDPQGRMKQVFSASGPTTGVAVDSIGNLFITEIGERPRIWMVRPDGTTEVVAGNGTKGFSGDGGPATSAQLNDPTSVAVDKLGNILVGDSRNLRIRKITRWIDYYNIWGMPYNGEDISFWFNFADNVWYSGNKAGEISLVGACPPWQCGATGIGATPTQVDGLTGIVAVTADAVLKSDGTVWALKPTYADGTTLISMSPTQVLGLSGVKAISGSTALRNDGTVWSFADSQPVQANGLSDVASIDEYGGMVLALKHDGTVWAWDGYGYSPVFRNPFEVSVARGAVAVASMAFGGLALMGDGTVWLFGLAVSNWVQLDVSRIVAIDGGYGIALALKDDGTVWDLDSTSVQVQGITGAVSISMGDRHSLALAQDGTVWEWGHDYQGLGHMEKTTWPTPRQVVGLTDVVKVAASWYHSLALRRDGTVWVWRSN